MRYIRLYGVYTVIYGIYTVYGNPIYGLGQPYTYAVHAQSCSLRPLHLQPSVMARFGQNCVLGTHPPSLGLARTVYIRIYTPYIWWFPSQKYRMYTVYIWFWPTLVGGDVCHMCVTHTYVRNTGTWDTPPPHTHNPTPPHTRLCTWDTPAQNIVRCTYPIPHMTIFSRFHLHHSLTNGIHFSSFLLKLSLH